MSDSNEKNWYIWRNGPIGPLSTSHVQKIILSGSLKRHETLSPNEGKDWIRVDNLFDFEDGKKIAGGGLSFSKQNDDLSCLEALPKAKDDLVGVFNTTWSIPLVRIVIFIGILPLLASRLFNHSTTLSVIFWGCYFSALWGILIWEVIKPDSQATRKGIAAGLFTIFAGLPLLHLLQQAIPITSQLYSSFVIPVIEGDTDNLAFRLTAFIIVVGMCEELVKLLPVIILSRKKENQTFSGLLWLSIVSGLGFAMAENISYSYRIIIQSAAKASTNAQGPFEAVVAMTGSYGSLLTMQLIRFITLPILHAAWVGIAACFLKYGYQSSKPLQFGSIGFLCAAGLHGLYNAASSYPFASLIMATLALLIFAGLLVKHSSIKVVHG